MWIIFNRNTLVIEKLMGIKPTVNDLLPNQNAVEILAVSQDFLDNVGLGKYKMKEFATCKYEIELVTDWIQPTI